MNKLMSIVSVFLIIALMPAESSAQYERVIEFKISFNESAFTEAQLRGYDNEITSFNPLEWIAERAVVSSAYGGEEFIESAGGAYPPQLEKYFDEMNRQGLFTIIMFDSRGNIVGEHGYPVEFEGTRTGMSRLVSTNRFGSVYESFSEEMDRDEETSFIFRAESGRGTENVFSSMNEAKRAAAEIGRRKAMDSRFAGNEGNASVMVVMFSPDRTQFEARVSPSIVTIYPAEKR